MKLVKYLLPAVSALVAVVLAQDAPPTAWSNYEFTVDPHNLETFRWDKEAEGSKLTLERFLDHDPAKLGRVSATPADFSKYRHYSCRDMPLVLGEGDPLIWVPAHINVCWSVVWKDEWWSSKVLGSGGELTGTQVLRPEARCPPLFGTQSWGLVVLISG